MFLIQKNISALILKKIFTKTNLKNIKNPTKNKIFVDYSPKWLYNNPMYANKEEKL